MNRFYFSLLLITFISYSFSQNGRISGTVLDSKTAETLPGAMVVIEGTGKGAVTDFDGKFTISNVAPGKVAIIISYISYDTKKIIDVNVSANDVTELTIQLDPSSSKDLNAVEVVVTLNKENNTALVLQQKNNASVSDGISSESIKKTPDRNTSDVIKRVSGATIQDNKFAIIRGMNDRYNTAYLNGAPLPSSESDRKAFSFDIFPANLLDNIIILKTATPDLPGDFAGGMIQVNTKSIPDKDFYTVSFGAGYNTQTTFKDFKTYEGGKTDWLGIDNGARAFPTNLPETEIYGKLSNPEKIDYAKTINYDWALKDIKAAPNLNFQYSMAKVGQIFKKDAGLVFALTYNSTNTTLFNSRREFEEQGDSAQKIRDYSDTLFSNNILASSLLNLSYKLTPNNQISFKNIFSVNTDDRVLTRKGLFDGNGPIWEKSNVRWFTENKIYSGQLIGEHLIAKPKITIKWIGAYSEIERDIPNLRKMVYQKATPLQDDTIPYTALMLENTVYPNSAGSMFFSNNRESIKSGRLDITKSFSITNTKHELKVGGYYQLRERAFRSRLMGYTKYKKGSQILFNDSLLLLNENEIFAPENMGIINGPGKYDGGFKLSEATTPIDSYTAKSILQAGYIMLDSRIKDKLRFIYGVRAEYYYQELKTKNLIGEDVISDTVNLDFLPSINAVYSLTDKINLRAAYFRTVCRPEFRELAPFNFYDFITDFSLSGEPRLVRSLINNYDLRFEWFPGAGQLISASGFYKEIENPIEQISNTASAIRSLLYTNAKKATNIGFEFEYRVKMSRLLNKDSSLFLNNTTFYTNFAYIKSKVDVGDAVVGTEAEIRPLQGQSPFIINGGIQYLDPDKGWGASISYNVVGRRIFIVGSEDEPTYWENPRHIIDLQLVKTFKKKLEIKLNARDLLAQNLIFYQDINKNGKLDKSSEQYNKDMNHNTSYDNIMINTRYAPTISFSISYKF